ncbi:ABC transporter permease [Luteipulveratus sp. YIM 133132]|uniref:ABC transporter permease n=1 Tax=Luteipulveratus flavus TaxID=3031728 RepID=A0ABT6C3Z2_9MICO|nr:MULTISPECIES: ABC transporter permease [unclassified Luteipulveratus]MDE9367544.1 ABC transporter permease [Luteipulveratus sp. YIM 133132]MDF8263391.1 ABC transporter permease [Luteipulveratus sp. YIM 133296]
MTTLTPENRIDAASRTVPPRGGLNVTLLRIELRRVLRNRRTMIFTLLMPVAFYFAFGNAEYGDDRLGAGNYAAYSVISFALYGAMVATTSAAASVSVERSQGWSRQLRLTPLSGFAYITVKVVAAMVLGLLPVALVYAVGQTGKAEMPGSAWITSAVLVWAGALMFAAFGLFMGYLLPTENAMQVIGPLMAFLAFGGGIFYPYPAMGSTMQHVAQLTPMWGVSMMAHLPLTAEGVQAWQWALNIVVWLTIFVGGAVWRFRRDTRRV